MSSSHPTTHPDPSPQVPRVHQVDGAAAATRGQMSVPIHGQSIQSTALPSIRSPLYFAAARREKKDRRAAVKRVDGGRGRFCHGASEDSLFSPQVPLLPGVIREAHREAAKQARCHYVLVHKRKEAGAHPPSRRETNPHIRLPSQRQQHGSKQQESAEPTGESSELRRSLNAGVRGSVSQRVFGARRRKQSRANPSLNGANSLLAGKIQGIHSILALVMPNCRRKSSKGQ